MSSEKIQTLLRFSCTLQDSSTVVQRIADWFDRQLHRLWRDAEFNAAAKLPRPSSVSQRQEIRGRLATLRHFKTTIAELGAAAESERLQQSKIPNPHNCEEYGVVSVEKVLASHGWLSPVDLELIYGASGLQTANLSARSVDERAQAARGLAWENRLWSLWRDLSAMERLMIALSEPSGPSENHLLPPATVGTLESLRQVFPRHTRRVALELLGMDANDHMRRWPELHRGRGYKNQATLIGTMRLHYSPAVLRHPYTQL